MDLIDQEDGAWFLLADGDALFLDVACQRSAVGFSVLIELTADERRAFVLEGHEAVDRLAIQVAALPDAFFDRQTLGRGHDVLDAVLRWRDSN